MERQTDPAGHHNNLSLNTAERQGAITSAQRLLELTFPLLASPWFFFLSFSLLTPVVKKDITAFKEIRLLDGFKFYEFLSPNVFLFPGWPGCVKYWWLRLLFWRRDSAASTRSSLYVKPWAGSLATSPSAIWCLKATRATRCHVFQL